MATLLAKNADVAVTMDGRRRELKNAGLFARDGVIEQVGLAAELPSTADRILDLRGHILLPGMINGHHHLDQVLTRNLPAGQDTNLFPWIVAHYRIWALARESSGVALNLNTVVEVEGSVVRRRNCPSGAMATRLPRHKCGNSRICPPPSWLPCKPKN